MQNLTLKDVLRLVDRAVQAVDHRLSGHGEQVAYVLSAILSEEGRCQQEIQSACVAAMFHDLGAYKIEERQRLEEFEVSDPHGHAVYGSLFVQHYAPFPELAPVIQYHHWQWRDREAAGEPVPEMAFALHLADRICLLAQQTPFDAERLWQSAGTAFCPAQVAAFFQADARWGVLRGLQQGEARLSLDRHCTRRLTADEAFSFARMLAFCIDFRSSHTVTHSVTVQSLAARLAELMGMPEEEVETISTAALVHDVGKISIPVDILEKPGKLTPEEFAVMQHHVLASQAILRDLGSSRIREIATLHHEKLDGSGYPYGLTAPQLSMPVRLVAVCDIASALIGERSYKQPLPKQVVVDTLRQMADGGKLDRDIVACLVAHYDVLLAQVDQDTADVLRDYRDMWGEYERICRRMCSVGNTTCQPYWKE